MSSLLLAPLSSFRALRLRTRCGPIGIDLGSREIKLAQVVQTNGQLLLAHTSRLPLPDHATYSPDSLSSGWLEQTLKPTARFGGFQGRNAAAVLSMSVTELRSIEVPPGSREDRQAMISHELQESNGAAEPMEFDFWDPDRTDSSGDSTPMANVLSVTSRVATLIAEQMQQAGLHCRILDGGPLALSRSVLLDPSLSPATEPIGLLDWGYHAVQFVIALRGFPAFTRLLKGCGIGQLVNQITRKLGLSEEEASELASAVGISQRGETSDLDADLQRIITEFAAEPLRQLSGELQKTLAFLRLQHSPWVPGLIVLTGGGATIRNMPKRLAAEVGLPVVRWQPALRERHAKIAPEISLFAQAASLSALGWQP